MPAYIHFDPLTNSQIAFATKEAFNAWMAANYIANADEAYPGVMLRAQTVNFSIVAYDNEDSIAMPVGGATYELPTLAHLEAVKTRLETLETAYATLLQKMKAAGQVSL